MQLCLFESILPLPISHQSIGVVLVEIALFLRESLSSRPTLGTIRQTLFSTVVAISLIALRKTILQVLRVDSI